MFQRVFRSVALLTALSMLLQLIALAAPASTAYAANPTTTSNPPVAPHSIEVFPQRDFVSVAGYAITETLTIEVIHSALYGGGTVSTAAGLVPQDDPATPEFDGIVEVNHPGGYCWVGATPDIRPGDTVRVTVDQTNLADATTVAGVVARRPTNPLPGTIVITGTAADLNGNPLPLDQIEQRLVSPGNLFDRNNRRTLRAAAPAADGLLAYDAPGSTSWTATYTGLSAADVTRAMEAESRMLWLGSNPLAAVEATLFEVGAGVFGGPQAPCTAPLEILPPPPGSELVPPTAPTGLAAAVSSANTVTLSWGASTDNVGVTGYGIYRNGVAIANVSNFDGSAPAPTGYVDYNVPPGAYVYTVDANDEIGNRSGLSNEAAATTTSQQAPPVAGVEPPASGLLFTAFPSRDFAEISGFLADDVVNVALIRNGLVISTAPGVRPHDLPGTPEFDGVVEVNHPGGYCWAGVTPEIRAGDILRATAYDQLGNVRVDEQITVANVTANLPVLVQADDPQTAAQEGVITISGTAQGADGLPIDIGQLEQRLVSSSANPFELSGRRTLIADAAGAGQGTLAYDTVDNPTGTKWTATYSGLSFIDVQLALSVESRIMWLGRDPLAGVELTIFEVGSADLPGPSAGFCSAPIETPDVTAPSAPGLTITPNGAARTVALSWTASTDDVGVYGYLISRDGEPLRYVGAGVLSYLDSGVLPGAHTYAVQALDSASPRGPGASAVEQLFSGLGGRYGNLSPASNAATVTMPDVTAPSVPADLVAVAGSGEVALSWAASSDDVATTGYNVYRNGVLVATVAAPGHTVAEPLVGSFSYSVDAFDAAGNVSAPSPAVTANVTEVPDSTAPTAPALSVSVPDLRARAILLSWTAATDAVGVTGYRVYRDGQALPIATLNGATLSYLDSNLPAETYSYTVRAVDSAGNASPDSNSGAATVANDPPLAPHSIIAFPARDFVSADGYGDAEGPAVVSVYRNGALVSESEPVAPIGGLVEVNHVDAGCWLSVTPDIRPGDLVRVTRANGVADQTVVHGVFAGRPSLTAPGTITVKGVAIGLDGLPIPAGQLEHRLLSVGANFTASGANTLRADAAGSLEGSLTMAGSAWTAVYSGLSAADINRALNGESHIQWLGSDPLAGVEGTIFENATGIVGGPEAGFCTAPAEGNVPVAGLSATAFNFGNVAYTPVAATSAPRAFTLTNAGAAPLTIYSAYIAGANPGDFSILSSTCGATLAAGAACTVQVTFTPTVIGARAATLNFLDTAANTAFQTITLSGTGTDAAAPTAPGVPAQGIGTAISGNLIPLTVNWTASTGVVTAYQLERSTNNGTTYTPVTLASPLATSTTVMVSAGANRFRVRACNGANCSAYATGANLNINAVQQNGAGTSVRGTWTNGNVTGAFGGTVRFATANTASLSYAPARVATTIQIAWVATKGPDRGRATVQIDGANVATIDLYAPTEQPAQVVYTSAALAANRSHTLTVVVLGNRNPLSTGNRVDVDGFVTLR